MEMGNVISVLAGVAMGLLGPLIIVHLSNRARQNELKLQLSHQEQESRRNRLVEARKDYLLPLRKTVSEWMLLSNTVVTAGEIFQMASKDTQSKRFKDAESKFQDQLQKVQMRDI